MIGLRTCGGAERTRWSGVRRACRSAGGTCDAIRRRRVCGISEITAGGHRQVCVAGVQDGRDEKAERLQLRTQRTCSRVCVRGGVHQRHRIARSCACA